MTGFSYARGWMGVLLNFRVTFILEHGSNPSLPYSAEGKPDLGSDPVFVQSMLSLGFLCSM